MPGETSAPKVHLVGSVPLESAEAVFRTVGGTLGDRIKRLPDGETGNRIDWIRMIQVMLNEHPDFEVDPETPPLEWTQWDGVKLRDIPQVKFKDGVDRAGVKFDTPYADSAIESFALFDKLQQDGVIAAGVKFQISVATPLAPTYNYVSPRAKDDFLPVYTKYLLGEVARMLSALPAERIAVQWDVCQELLMWEGYYDFRRRRPRSTPCPHPVATTTRTRSSARSPRSVTPSPSRSSSAITCATAARATSI